MLIHTAKVELTLEDIDNYDSDLMERYEEHDLWIDLPVHTLDIVEDFEDILTFLFEQEFNVPYHINSYTLEKGGKEFVLELENKWFKNELDVFALYTENEAFKQWLESRYIAKTDIKTEMLEEITQFMESELEDVMAGDY